MAQRAALDEDLPTLASRVVHEAGTLLSEQVDLLRAEVGQELRRAAGGAAAVAAGGGLAAAGGLLGGFMAVHLLHRATRLPLWCCYGVVAGALGTTAAALLRSGGQRLAGVQLLPPPQTAAALGENLTWLKEQLTPAAP